MTNDSIRMAEDNRLEQERMDWENNSVFATIGEDTTLTTFSSNLENNELSESFTQEEGPYTLFAPSNEAYQALSQEEIAAYMDPENIDENSAMLYYLAVDEELTEEELRQEIEAANGTYTLTTMQGETIIASLEGEEVVLSDGAGNKATITGTDMDASNGIVHVIDRVLMPQDATRNAAGDMNMNRSNTQNTTNTDTGAK